jgi:hypothetical protein
MGTLLRRVRGLLGTALTWGAGWFVLSAIVWGVTLFGDVPFGMILNLAAAVGVAGAVAGAGFAVVLGIAERSRTLDELSFLRITTWGALGGMLVGLPFLGELAASTYPAFFGILAGLGATSASGSLALARMADDDRVGRERERRALTSGGE